MLETVVVLFNRDLRTVDHPALSEAVKDAHFVVPLFVIDEKIIRTTMERPNALSFLLDALNDLRSSLISKGADLIVRQGDPVKELIKLTTNINASGVYVTSDSTPYAKNREQELAKECYKENLEFKLFPGATVIDTNAIYTSSTGTPYKIFTPYWKKWISYPRRSLASEVKSFSLPEKIQSGSIPSLGELTKLSVSPNIDKGGESIAHQQLDRYLQNIQDDNNLAYSSSRMSPYLHFGCISPLTMISESIDTSVHENITRQLCWRDFYQQLVANIPEFITDDLRTRPYKWNDHKNLFIAWSEGMTGFPIIDAGMRQLKLEGWIHNRIRLVVASFLTKHLRMDWRLGAKHFSHWLVDVDVSSNVGNWQWIAGTGTDTRPNRILNPILQSKKIDPSGNYIKKYVKELSVISSKNIHEPWKLSERDLRGLQYPHRVIDHEVESQNFRTLIRNK